MLALGFEYRIPQDAKQRWYRVRVEFPGEVKHLPLLRSFRVGVG